MALPGAMLLVVAAISVVVVILVIVQVWQSAAVRKLARERALMTTEIWASQYFGELAAIDRQRTIEVAQLIAEAIGLHVTQLRPTDNVLANFFRSGWLAVALPDERWETLTSSLADYVQEHCKCIPSDAELEAFRWGSVEETIKNTLALVDASRSRANQAVGQTK